MTSKAAFIVIACVVLGVLGGGCDDGEGAGGGTKRIDLDIAGCAQGVQALSLLVRIEADDGAAGQCRVDEKCLDVSFSGASADDIESALRSQGFPLFDLPADQVQRVTIGLSATGGCPLGVLTTGCGSAPISVASDVITVNVDCSSQPACATVSGDCPAASASAPPIDGALEDIWLGASAFSSEP